MLAGWLILAVAALAAWTVTLLMLRNAARLRLVQAPNERSSHALPTPSGGGIGIVCGSALATLATATRAPWPLLDVLAVAILVAAIGFVDDRTPLPAVVRLPLQLLLVGLAVGLCVPIGALQAAIGWPLPAVLVAAIAVVGVVYWINLFNFMDGIDGIAASQAIFMTGGAALLAALHVPGASIEPLLWSLLGVAAASLGFLILNWPPAKIFMGDAGSTYLGFMIALLAPLSITAGWLTLAQWAVLGAAFVTDATVTLLRRLLRGERIFEAHRLHAYQVLSRRWGSHRAVTLAFVGLNVVGLLPLAYLAGLPGWGPPAVSIAYVPLVALAFRAGAGAPERLR